MRTFNLKLILWLAGIFVLTAIAVHFTHRYQVLKNAGSYLELATKQEEQARAEAALIRAKDVKASPANLAKALESATINYRRYLAFDPANFNARAKYGRLLLDIPANRDDLGRAYFQFERVLRDIPATAETPAEQAANEKLEKEIRTLQVNLALSPAIRRFGDAFNQLEILKAKAEAEAKAKNEPLDVVHGLSEQQADIKLAMNEPDIAKVLLEGAVDSDKGGDPHRISAYRRLLDLLQRDPDAQKARDVALRMKDLNPDNPDAFSAFAKFNLADVRPDNREGEKRPNKVARAEEYCAKALAMRPDDPDDLELAALIALNRFDAKERLAPDFEQARDFLRKSLDLKPGVAGRYDMLARAEVGAHEKADDLIGGLIAGTGIYKEGVDKINELTKAASPAREPDLQATVELRFNWADMLIGKEATSDGLTDEEKATLETLVTDLRMQLGERPVVRFLDAYRLAAQKQWQIARGALEKVQKEFETPLPNGRPMPGAERLLPRIRQLLAQCYVQLGNDDLRVATFKAIFDKNPLDPNAVRNYADALISVGKFDEGMAEYERWRSLVGDRMEIIQFKRYFLLRFNAASRLPRIDNQRTAALNVLEAMLNDFESTVDDKKDPWPVLMHIELTMAKDRAGRPADVAAPDNALGITDSAIDTVKKDLADARKSDAYQDSLPIWTVSVELLQRLKDPAADEVWKQLEDHFHDTYDVRLAKARYLINSKGRAAVPELAALTENMPVEISKLQQVEMNALFGKLCASVGEFGEGLKYLLNAVELSPGQLPVRVFALQTAQQALNVEAAQKLAAEIQEISPGSDDAHYAQAVPYLTKFTAAEKAQEGSGDLADLMKAENELVAAKEVRPNWALPYIVLAAIEGQRRNDDAAAKYCQKAIELGANDPSLVVTAVNWLTRRGQVAEADQLIQKIEAAGAGEVSIVAVKASELAAEMEDYERAIDRRYAAISGGLTSAQQFLALAYLYKAQGNWGKTLENLDKAIVADMAEKEGKGTGLPYLIKVQMLMARSRQETDKDEAEKRVKEANDSAAALDGQKNLPETVAKQMRAQCQDALGNSKLAATMFDEALAASPDDVTLHEAAARFFARNARNNRDYRAKAVQILDRFLKGELKRPDDEKDAKETNDELVVWARREMASIEADSSTYAGFQEALNLSRENIKALSPPRQPGESDEQYYAKFNGNLNLLAEMENEAQILATREQKSYQQEAIRLLEDRAKYVPPPSLDTQFLLAQLYLAQGRWTDASKLMADVVASAQQSADRIADRSSDAHAKFAQYANTYINALLEHGEITQAQGWISVWRRTDPISFRATLAEARSLVPRPQPKAKTEQGDGKQAEETKPELKVAEALASLEMGVSVADLSALEKQQRTLFAVLTMEDLLQIANEYGTPADADLLKARIREYYQRILAADANLADQRQLMQVRFLVLAGERQQAVELLKANWEKADANTLVIACAALLNHADELQQLEQAAAEGKLTAEQFEAKKKELFGSVGEAELIAQQALVKRQQELAASAPNVDAGKLNNVTTLLSLLGGHYLATKRYDEAMQAYTQILNLNPGHIVALNNRAMIMAGTKTNLPEALTQVDSAIQMVGPLPLIVDSKAMVLYAAGQYIEALAAAQQVIAEVPDHLDPVKSPGLAKTWGGYYFHLAVMFDANKEQAGAAEAMKKARELGFGEADVSDLEMGLWKEISGKISG